MATETQPQEKQPTHAPWQREFFKNIDIFVKNGLDLAGARKLLTDFLKLSAQTPIPPVMKSFHSEELLDQVGVLTSKIKTVRDFMVRFLSPLMSNFIVEGKENLQYVTPLLDKYPITLIANHMSHLDAPIIYNLLYREEGLARELADRLIFIAGRLAFEPDFTRLGLYMFDTLLVCSQRDMSENPRWADLMTRINMRSFRQSQQLQKQGRVIAIFPEGTRSRTGKLINFIDTSYHYVNNKIILPITLSGTDDIMPTSGFLMNPAIGKLTIGKPVLVGKLPSKLMDILPDYVEVMEIPKKGDRKQFIIDNLALLVGQNLSSHRHGTYRNLYAGDIIDSNTNVLIQKPHDPIETVVIIGHSSSGTAAATTLANKKVNIQIYLGQGEKSEKLAHSFNERRVDEQHYPLFKLPPNITFTADPAVIATGTLFLQAAHPWELEHYFKPIKDELARTTGPIINLTKGFTDSKKGLILDDLVDLGLDPARLGVLAGANYPDQVMERKLTGYELAVNMPEMVDHLTKLFSTGYVFTRSAVNPTDVRGVQLGGALKSVYALAIGLLSGYYEKMLGGNCDNSLFHLSHRILEELTKLGVELGGLPSTFEGLSGRTDFMLSCFAQDAQDRQYAHNLVFGQVESDAKLPSLFGLQVLPKLIQLDPERYPIAFAIHSVIIEKKDPGKVLEGILYLLRRF